MAISRKKKHLFFGLFTGILTGILVSITTHKYAFDFFNSLERETYDFRWLFKYGIFPSESKDLIEGVVVVDIDERALAKLGPYTKWPRSYHAKVVENLSLGGASAIAFDIIFKTADFGEARTNEVMKILKNTVRKVNWDEYLPAIRHGLNDDSVLVTAVARSGCVIGDFLFNNTKAYQNPSDYLHLSTEERHLDVNPGSSADFPPELRSHIETKTILDNIFPEFGRACSRIGPVNVVPDDDGPHRSIPLLYNFPDTAEPGSTIHTYPVLTLQTALYLLGRNLSDVKIVPKEYVNLGSPLRVFRKNGRLITSYPKLTFSMVKALVEKRSRLNDLLMGRISSMDVSSPVIIRRPPEGELEVEILEGQFIPWGLALKLVESNHTFPEIKTYNAGSPLMFSDHEGLFFREKDSDSDEPRTILFDSEQEDTVSLNNYTLSAILHDWPAPEVLEQLSEGSSYTVSGYLNLGYNREKEELISPILVLTAEVASELASTDLERFSSLKEGEELAFGREIKIPIQEITKMFINFQGLGKANTTFRFISYYDVLANRLDPTFYQGKAFILGSSAEALFDIVSSPFDETFPGIEIHATLLHNMLTNNFMDKLKRHQDLLILLGLSLVVGIFSYFLHIFWSFPLFLLVSFLYAATAFTFFLNGMWVEIARPEITIFTTFLLVTLARYLIEEREKKFLNDAFKSYISPELIDIMVDSGSKPSLGGTEAFLTAYFTDIQGFSTFSEKLGSPTKLVELLNEYLSSMTDILLTHRGTLDKYEGDAIIAFFGAPVKMEDHAEAACIAGLSMQEQLGELRKKWRSEGDKWPQIVHDMRMRIGINSGPIVTGNMGSHIRMNYTMMGDTVNLAARLESGAKQYGVYTVASRETLEKAGDRIFSRELDKIKVVGKSEPVTIFELLCFKDTLTPDIEKCCSLFAEGLELYRRRKWDEAARTFSESEKYEPNHPDHAPGCKTCPSIVLLERCTQYKHDRRIHLPDDWDGVYVATEK